MANVFSKTPDANGVYSYKRSVHSPDYPTNDWLINPDVSLLEGGSPPVPELYWKAAGSPLAVIEMTQGEKDAVDAALAPVSFSDGHGFSDQQSYAVDETKIITLPLALPDVIIHVLDPAMSVLTGESLVSGGGTGWDPGNVSTGEANINNGNLSDLVYNNSSTGNTSGLIFGIDLGSATAITAMRRYDYNASYYDTQWEFIGTNDSLAGKDTAGRYPNGSPLDWEVIFSTTQSAYASPTTPFFQTFTEKTYRYYGVRCVSSFNATYSIVSELELLTGTLATVEKELIKGTEYDYNILSPTSIEISNKTGQAKTLKVVVVGK